MKAPFGGSLALGGRKDSWTCINCHGAHDEVEEIAEKPMRGDASAISICRKPGDFNPRMAR